MNNYKNPITITAMTALTLTLTVLIPSTATAIPDAEESGAPTASQLERELSADPFSPQDRWGTVGNVTRVFSCLGQATYYQSRVVYHADYVGVKGATVVGNPVSYACQ